MGLNKSNTETNVVYLLQGKVVMLANKSETTIEKNGKFYEPYKSISGRITNFEVVKGYNEGDRDVKITFSEDGEDLVLVFGLDSSYFKSFAKMFPNLDINSSLELFPTFKIEEGKNKTGLVIKQGDGWIKRAFTIDNMGKCPVAIPVEVNGKVVYDYSSQNDFLLKNIETILKKEKLPF